jgi:hypothetical protein
MRDKPLHLLVELDKSAFSAVTASAFTVHFRDND